MKDNYLTYIYMVYMIEKKYVNQDIYRTDFIC